MGKMVYACAPGQQPQPTTPTRCPDNEEVVDVQIQPGLFTSMIVTASFVHKNTMA
jgi:hypothetical protein